MRLHRWPRPDLVATAAHSALRRAALCGAVALATLATAPIPRQITDPVAALAWMAGCWQGTLASGAVYEEVWMAPKGGVMMGISRVSRAERVVGWEFLRIADEEGAAVYFASPGGRGPTPFRAVRVDVGEAVFDNPGHDYPQRIIYRQTEPGSLHARIEGVRGGESRATDFPLTRVACPGATSEAGASSGGPS